MKCTSTDSGIYKITCTENGKFYIGSTINFRTRCRTHRYTLNANTHKNRALQSAWNKYGKKSFIFEIIDRVSCDDLIAVEQMYLDTLQPFDKVGYNLVKIAGSQLGKRHSKESKIKMSRSAKNRKSPSRFTKIDQIGIDGEIIKTWTTIKEARVFYNAKSQNSILQVLDHPRWMFAGFRWRRHVENELD